MKEIEITKSNEDPFIKGIEETQNSIDEINSVLVSIGFPRIEIKVRNLEDVMQYLSKKTDQPIEDITSSFDLENKTKE